MRPSAAHRAAASRAALSPGGSGSSATTTRLTSGGSTSPRARLPADSAAQAGLNGDYGSHSLRRGLATEAIANGVPEHAVMRHGRWRSSTTMRSYVDDAERFADTNPTRHLRLHAHSDTPTPRPSR